MSDGTYPQGRPGGAGVVPGWYPDPAGGPVERWWDGAAWTAQTRAQSVLTQPLGRPAVIRNTPATAALVLGVVALLFNTMLLVSVATVVLAGVGLSRSGRLEGAGYAPVGRARAIWALVLAVLGGAQTVLLKALLF